MATVTSQLTRIHDLEGSLSLSSIGGGAGAAANTDIFIQDSQSVGRRLSNVTLSGWWLTDAAPNDLSAANIHLGMWVWVTHYASLTDIRIRAGASQTAYDEHQVPVSQYPNLGGWMRVWLDISRTPEATAGGGGDESAMDEFALLVSLPTVGGNAANVIMDAIDHTTTGLLLTGTAGVWNDFVTADANSTNRYGVVAAISGTLFVSARLLLGSASSLVFSDSQFVIVFPNQTLVANDFMGISIDLQNGSTSITWADAVIRSAGAKQGDILVSGTSGSFDASGMTLGNLRTIDLTAACSLLNSTISACDKMNQNGATISGCSISGATTADGEAFLISDDPELISDCDFTFSDGHAIEITTPGTYTFSGNTFSGYGADSSNDAAIYNNSGGLVTLNITGGGSTPTIRNGSGASTVVNNNVSVTLTGLQNPTEVRVYAAGTTTLLAGQEDVTTGSFVFSLSAGTDVDIRIFAVGYLPADILNFEVPTSDATIPIQQQTDRFYLNP